MKRTFVWILGAITALQFAACSQSTGPAPTPDRYEVFMSRRLDFPTAPPYYFHWVDTPTYLGSGTETADFEMGAVDTARYLIITMNTNEERFEKAGKDRYEEPGEVWFDAVQDVQTGRFIGRDVDGNNTGYELFSALTYDVIDTTTGQLGHTESITNIVGPPDGKYIAFGVYESSMFGVKSFDGVFGDTVLIANGPGPDIRIYARRAPAGISARPVHSAPVTPTIRTWDQTHGTAR